VSADTPENEADEQTLAALAAIWERSKETIMGRVDVLDRAAVAVLKAGLDDDLRRNAEEAAHKLTGSVGTFGFGEGLVMARQIEQMLQGESPLSQEQVLRLSELAVSLRRVLEQPPVGQVPEQPPAGRLPEQPPSGRELKPADEDERPLLLVAVENQELARRLILEAGARGLRGKAAADPGSIRRVMSSELPEAVVLDQLLGPEGADGRGLLGELTACSPPVPVLLLASLDIFANRLEAARLGVRRFLAGPMPPSEVLDAVLRTLPRLPYPETGVLAVDGDARVLARLRELLEPLHVRCTGLNDPLRCWDTLETILPDLLLLDVDLPQISGTDLCRAVRNDPRWFGLPVMFLSASAGIEAAAVALAADGDDFINKSILGAELVTRIIDRLALPSPRLDTVEPGNLTGVAGRRPSAEAPVQLLRQADSRREPLCLAVLDIDRLRQINERCGRATGDLVLRRFGEILNGMLHGGDRAGRWGGGEFVVGMGATTLEQGLWRLEQLQEELGGHDFACADGSPARTAFSAGVA
jgi:diguanylate cyclase (GGDEF)-like protein